MRLFTGITAAFIVLVAAGSIYLHIDTKRFVEELPEPPHPVSTHDNTEGLTSPDSDTENAPKTTAPESDEADKVFVPESASPPAWWDDAAHDTPGLRTDDPWKAVEEYGLLNADGTLVDPNSPEFQERFRQQLIKQFGDIPEVHIVADGGFYENRHIWTIDDKIRFAEAHNKLFPSVNTQNSLNFFYAQKSGDPQKLMDAINALPTQNVADKPNPFEDLAKYFEGNPSPANGFRQLRKDDPVRSAQFEKYAIEELENSDDTELRKRILRAIEDSYKPEPAKTETP